ncbi:hypothetical protein RCZ15_20240 [Capnocytophaga catalasegens]|uniref:Sec-independent protein translocase protein TatA n=2 Tax=Capnocytophaga catalasegens TaxID=1004260 RepID=A0AAV5AZR8_9FLAO|nr:hypothetical protein RCZ03_14630 [Capnocytophaga catalasegens]GJM51051.1 hypothetical protein RCZ15_20240 [Capnocytophaga catalasegens]GJM52236.1 hypothetical protein RCZ16_05540 [Capnocytophaga catalasegens]
MLTFVFLYVPCIYNFVFAKIIKCNKNKKFFDKIIKEFVYLQKKTLMVLFISPPEILTILFIALMLFGADKIPEIARTLGKIFRQLRDATNEIKSEINKSAEKNNIDTSLIDDIQKEIDTIKDEIEDPLGRVKRNK